MANKGVKGRIIYAETGEVPEKGLFAITAVDFDPFFSEDDVLASGTTDENGNFELSYPEDKYKLWFGDRRPDIVVRVFVGECRLLLETEESKDVEVEMLDVGTLAIHKNNVEGWLVTNATLDPSKGEPVELSQGNQVNYLIDGATMFPAITRAVRAANSSVHLMTLNFEAFVVDGGIKRPLITEFSEDFNPIEPDLSVKPCDQFISTFVKGRLQDEIKAKAAAGNGFSANVLVNDIPLSAGDFVGEVNEFFENTEVKVRDFNKGLSLLHTKNLIVDGQRAFLMGSPISQRYFNDTGHLIQDARHRGSLFHDVNMEVAGPAVDAIDKTFATIWKASVEASDAPVITPASGNPPQTGENIVSAQVLRTMPGGVFTSNVPQVDHLPHGETAILEAYQRAISNAQKFIYFENQYFTSPDIVSALIARMKAEDKPKLQIIFVLNFKPDLPGYADKQRTLLNLLKIKAEKHGHKLGVYTLWSRQEKKPASADGNGKPEFEIMPIYVHSKVAVIDDTWATIGSANLDGTSMNYHQIGLMVGSALFDKLKDKIALGDDFDKFLEKAFFYLFNHVASLIYATFQKYLYLSFAVFKILLGLLYAIIRSVFDSDFRNEVLKTVKDYVEMILEVGQIPDALKDVFERPAQHALPHRSGQPPRNIELNLVLYNGIAGQPDSPVVNQLRNQLWQEHLGLEQLPGNMKNVPDDPAEIDWVKAWNDIAKDNLAKIRNREKHPAQAPKILEWAPETEADDYLSALKVRTKGLRSKGEKFDFEKCEWKKKPPAKTGPWPM